MRHLILSLLFLIPQASALSVLAAPPPVALTEGRDAYPLGRHLEYLEDPAGTLTIEDVTAPPLSDAFRPGRQAALNFGYTRSAYWVRFRVQNRFDTDKRYLLELGFSNMHHAACFRPRIDRTGFEKTVTGVRHPFSTRDIPYHQIVFSLDLPPNSEQTVHLRFQSEGSMSLPLTLLSETGFRRRAFIGLLFSGLFYGGLLIMICYNIFLYMALREPSHSRLVAFLISIVLAQATYEGVDLYFLGDAAPGFRYFLPLLLLGLIGITGLNFLTTFLDTRSRAPRIHRILNALIAAWLLLLALMPFIGYFHGIRLAMLMRLFISPFFLFTALIVWRRGYRPAGYMALAFGAMILGNVMLTLTRAGMFPSGAVSEHGYQIGTLMMIVLLSLAVADRISLLREEREQAREEALEAMEEKKRSLEAAEARYRSLFENAVEGIFQSIPGRGYLSVNPSFARILKYDSPDEVIASVTDAARQIYVYPEDREKLIRMIARDGRVDGFETQIYRKDKKILWVSIRARRVLDARGSMPYYEGSFIDITKAKRSELELIQRTDELTAANKRMRESEEKFRSLFENAIEGIFQSTPGGVYINANPSLARILGFDSPEQMVTSVTDIAQQIYARPEDREKMKLILEERAFASDFETRLHRRGGGVIWASMNVRRVADALGQVMYYEGFVTDITRRRAAEEDLKRHREHLAEMVEQRTAELTAANEKLKDQIKERLQAENALKESERKLYNIIQFLPNATLVIDGDGRVIAWNQAMENLTGVAADEMIGKGDHEYALPFYGERRPILIDLAITADDAFEKKYPRLSRSGGVISGESFTPRLPGGGAYLLATAAALWDSRGRIAGAIEVIRDITDRKRAEDELRQTRDYLENVVENSPNWIAIADRRGNIVKWNRMAAELSGYGAEEIRRVKVHDLYADPDDFETVRKTLRESGVISRHEMRVRKKDGGAIPVEASMAVLKDPDGKPVGSIAIISDLSEIKKALTEAREARKAAEDATRKIMSSIDYARMIQRALLANVDVVKTYLPDSFFLWEPRDVVGGDIYFIHGFDGGFILAVIDCTGHGVPGAFMTMIAISALNRIVKDEGFHDPPRILKRLNRIVRTTLHQDKDYAVSDDGMDVGIVRVTNESVESHALSFQTTELTFAGAKIPLYCVQDGEIRVIRGDRQSIGYRRSDPDFRFTGHAVATTPGMAFYLATDGFSDQIGGSDERKFGVNRFMKALREAGAAPMEAQRRLLLDAFEEHRGKAERLDDMTVVGFRF